MKTPLFSVLGICCTFPAALFGQDVGTPTKQDDRAPGGVSLLDEAEAAMKKFTVSPGLRVELWASEPLLANPVALAFDDRGRAFVAETYRRRTSALDIRKHESWTIEDLALRSVEDRVAFLKKKLPESEKRQPTRGLPDSNNDGQFDWRDLEVESERVKIVEDSNGDGKADQSRVLTDGFNSLATVVGAGVLAHGDDVYYTCIPDLWKIRADGTKERLLTGFGVHVAYGGHDMHGVKVGPDGRLYWSIADIGARVVGKEGQVIDVPDTGAIFRCELDGSGLELVAKGLRNPQSLAWNDVGDLFTGDNNADGGDKARWIHVVEGADYGWRIGWQFLPKLGAWNSEGMWHLDTAEKNLSILPPVGHIGHGPAGIAYYPGTGLPDAYRDHFFYADFPGGVRAFKLTPKGASYTVENPGDILQDNTAQKLTGKVLWGLYPSDVAFAPGGGLYVLDWIQGWEKTGKGRIFRVSDPKVDAGAIVQETKRLLNEGFGQKGEDDLVTLLAHADQRVRLRAQFELVKRGASEPLIEAALARGSNVRRLHGIWGLARLARLNPALSKELRPLASDHDSEVRAQYARFLADTQADDQVDLVEKLLTDEDPRVLFFAARAAGKIRLKKAAPTLVKLATAAKEDPVLRHSLVSALIQCGGTDELSRASRKVSLLASLRTRSPTVADFLAEPELSLDAARAIHDLPIPEVWPQLAAMATRTELAEPLWRRAINANYLIGTDESAARLGIVATDRHAPRTQRVFAIESLAIWNQPFGRDQITGLWRDMRPRDEAKGAKETAEKVVPTLLGDADGAIRLAACRLASEQKVNSVASTLESMLSEADSKTGGSVKAAALEALAAMGSPIFSNAWESALASKEKLLLEAARKLAPKISPSAAVKVNAMVLGTGSPREQQEALATISHQAVPEADRVIAEQLELLANGKLSPALILDLVEAAGKRTDAAVKAKIATFEQARKAGDPLVNWRECLEGGDAKLGREIFFEKAEAACLRCHKVKGEGGDVGPDIAGIGKKYDRESLLRSVVEPSATIAPGYDNVMLTLKDGSIAAGILSADDQTTVTLKSLVDGAPQKIEKAKIKERTGIPSAMPPSLGEVLGKRGLRDVIEYLATLK